MVSLAKARCHFLFKWKENALFCLSCWANGSIWTDTSQRHGPCCFFQPVRGVNKVQGNEGNEVKKNGKESTALTSILWYLMSVFPSSLLTRSLRRRQMHLFGEGVLFYRPLWAHKGGHSMDMFHVSTKGCSGDVRLSWKIMPLFSSSGPKLNTKQQHHVRPECWFPSPLLFPCNNI